MLTALDIQNKEFSKSMRGYSEEEVDIFLDELIVDYQALIDRNKALEDQVSDLNQKLVEYKSTEGSVIKTLESAKALMKDISLSAEKRASMLIQNAEIEAANKLRQVDEDVRTLTAERAKIEASIVDLKLRLKKILEYELARVNEIDDSVK